MTGNHEQANNAPDMREFYQTISTYASQTSCIGIYSSLAWGLIWLRSRPWSWSNVFISLIPLLGFGLTYLIIKSYLKPRYDQRVPLAHPKLRLVTALGGVLLVALHLGLWYSNRIG